MRMIFWLWNLVSTEEFDFTKLDVYVEHKFFRFDSEGNRNVTKTRYDIRKCTASDFNNTQYEREKWAAL